MYNKKLAIKPIERLTENMECLEEMVLNPQKGGEYTPIGNESNESKAPINIGLFDFKQKMEADIRRVCRKIERKLGYELPDGLK
jgi:hypothetical protein